MRKTAILVLFSLLLASCVGMDSRMTVRENGSGTLVLAYRISQLVADMGVSASGKNVVPLPLSRADFERSLSAANGKVRLTKFDRSENENDISIRSELAFDSLEALGRVEAFRDSDLKAGTIGSAHTFSQVIARRPAEPLTDESKRMVEALFKGYELSFTFQAPRAILTSTLGGLSADKKTVTWKASISDIVATPGDIVMSLSW